MKKVIAAVVLSALLATKANAGTQMPVQVTCDTLAIASALARLEIEKGPAVAFRKAKRKNCKVGATVVEVISQITTIRRNAPNSRLLLVKLLDSGEYAFSWEVLK